MKEEFDEPIPAIDDAPVLWPHLRWVWICFVELSRTRQFTQVINAISYQEILAYSQLHEIGYDDLRELLHFVPKLDAHLVAKKTKEARDEMDKAKNRPRPGSHK